MKRPRARRERRVTFQLKRTDGSKKNVHPKNSEFQRRTRMKKVGWTELKSPRSAKEGESQWANAGKLERQKGGRAEGESL